MGSFVDLTGRRFGRLLVLGRATNKNRHVRWECRCDCGNSAVPHATSLKSGSCQSCGCLSIERTKASNTRHGHTSGHVLTPEFRSWTQMIRRCTEPNSGSYSRYGAVGVTVCEEWLKFESFLASVGARPAAGYAIDRIDGTKGYEPGNVKWSSVHEQNRNKKSNRWIEFNGKRLVAADWARELGMDSRVIYGRFAQGITDPAELLAPAKRSA